MGGQLSQIPDGVYRYTELSVPLIISNAPPWEHHNLKGEDRSYAEDKKMKSLTLQQTRGSLPHYFMVMLFAN